VTGVWFFGRKHSVLDAGVRSDLYAEGIQVLDEFAPATVIYRHYRAPGRRYGYRKTWTKVALALTERRLLVRSRWGSLVDLPWQQARAGGMRTTLDGDSFLVTFEAGSFSSNQSGSVEVRVTSPQAATAATIAQAKLG